MFTGMKLTPQVVIFISLLSLSLIPSSVTGSQEIPGEAVQSDTVIYTMKNSTTNATADTTNATADTTNATADATNATADTTNATVDATNWADDANSSAVDEATHTHNEATDDHANTTCDPGHMQDGTACVACQPGFWCDGLFSHQCDKGLFTHAKADTEEDCSCAEDYTRSQCTAVVSFNVSIAKNRSEFDHGHYISAVAMSLNVPNTSVTIVLTEHSPTRRLLSANEFSWNASVRVASPALPSVAARRLLAADTVVTVQTSVTTTPAVAARVATDHLQIEQQLRENIGGDIEVSTMTTVGAATVTSTPAVTTSSHAVVTTTTPETTTPAATPDPEEAPAFVVWIAVAVGGAVLVCLLAGICIWRARRKPAAVTAEGKSNFRGESEGLLNNWGRKPLQANELPSAYTAHHVHADPASYVVMRIPQSHTYKDVIC